MDAMLLSGRGSSDEFKNISDAVSELKKLKDELNKNGHSLNNFADSFGSLEGAISSSAASMRLMEGTTASFGDKLKQAGEKFGIWLSSAEVIHKLYEITKKVVSQVSEIDTAMTELRKVTDETNTTYANFLEESSTRATSLDATMGEVINASADFARLGYSLEGASALADAAIVYKNVGDGINDINSASESIISTMQAFKISAEDAMLVVDKFNNVGNNFAISSGGIGDALLNSAASLHAAGNTLDESIALIAAANTTIQNPERVGTALKTMSMYIRAAKTEAEEAGIATDGMADSVSELRGKLLALTGQKVDIMEDENTYKSTVQILRDLSQVWGELSDTSKTNITELIGGGVRNANVIAALMGNFELVEQVLDKTATAAGSALAENEKYLDSIAGKTA